jgi:PTS system fructose-specific IID component
MENNDKKITKSDLTKMFLRSNFFAGSFNFERTQSLGFTYTMLPIIKRLYKSKEEQTLAMKRHMEWFNTQPWVASLILGVTASMEEQRANGKEIDDKSISSIKVGLMGPLAGVGDPLFWGTARPVFAALGAALALNGNILGPVLFFLAINAVRLFVRYTGIMYGYSKGKSLISDMKGNVIQKFTEIASIVGLFVMGALVCKWTSINIIIPVTNYTDQNGNQVQQSVQNILDSMAPGLLPLGATFLVALFLRKGVNPLAIILAIFVLGILGYGTGFLG